jgi:DNA-binding response OmpR family regulator
VNTDVAPHILVIDDDPAIRGIVAEYFGLHDLRVSLGSSGRDLFEQLEQAAIDLVLLDLKLPGEDGRCLRASCASGTLPIALTGRNGKPIA